ncbi:MAG: HAD family phosphatase [Candidatus Hinthialibacter antarcticus]|nr:HAD family phosphatase [Candidatus Hinthialibacter antarcticus]
MIEAFLFDMDGTLLDTEVLWLESVQSFLQEQSILLPREEALSVVYGIAWSDIYQELRRRYPQLQQSKDAMSKVICEHFFRLREQRDIRIHSSVELLKQLATTHPIAIVSGSDSKFIEYGIDLMDIRSLLKFYLGGEHYSPGKPDPCCYQMAAQRLGLSPDACLVFEDSSAGIRAAKAAGMHCVALARSGRPMQDVELADMILNDLAAFSLDEYLDEFQQKTA